LYELRKTTTTPSHSEKLIDLIIFRLKPNRMYVSGTAFSSEDLLNSCSLSPVQKNKDHNRFGYIAENREAIAMTIRCHL